MKHARRFYWLPVLLVAGLASSCIGTGNSVNAYAGARSIESSDFEDIDDPTVYGLDAVLKLNIPWLAVEGGWFHSDQDESSSGAITDPELAVDEYFVGLRVTPWDFLISPYGAIGVSYLEGDLDGTVGGTDAGDSDESIAYYVRLGAALTFGIFRFGLDGRYETTDDLDLNAIESDLDNAQVTAFVGIGF